jgi:hypothetical protein
MGNLAFVQFRMTIIRTHVHTKFVYFKSQLQLRVNYFAGYCDNGQGPTREETLGSLDIGSKVPVENHHR